MPLLAAALALSAPACGACDGNAATQQPAKQEATAQPREIEKPQAPKPETARRKAQEKPKEAAEEAPQTESEEPHAPETRRIKAKKQKKIKAKSEAIWRDENAGVKWGDEKKEEKGRKGKKKVGKNKGRIRGTAEFVGDDATVEWQ
ncbi:hypothetical protein HY992_01190 [Candidatus Micrarchaeota archaeon]|nr:hypothetical protein [Candidatus Micrarchaeota archaeon]